MKSDVSPFKIPILKIKVKDWENKKKKLLELPDWEDENCFYTDHFTDYHKYSVDGNGYVPEFCHIMDEEFRQICEEFKVDQLNVMCVWAQRYAGGQYMGAHNHGHSGFSAVLYTDFDPSVHHPTRFHAPFINFLANRTDWFDPEVEEGDIIIFPSYLMHEVRPSTTDKMRTIFSFNVEVRN